MKYFEQSYRYKTRKDYFFWLYIQLSLLLTLSFTVTVFANDEPIINLADDYYALFEQTHDMPLAERSNAFADYFNQQFAPFYRDKAFNKSLEQFESIKESYLAKEKRLTGQLDQSMASFLTSFSDFKSDRPIYIVHSLGQFNGATRELDGKPYLLFGIDVMVRFHQWQDDTPFFHHELFHVYHEKFFECGDALWCSLWSEGLATYVSHQLNTAASEDELMLNIPNGLAADTKANLLLALSDLKAKLFSTDEEHYKAYFNFKADETGLPPRRGYYLGYLIAQELGKKYSLQALAKMNAKQLRPIIIKAIDLLQTQY
ncbi:hypothetical protein [Thalassotalea ganghwensis]